MVYSSTNIKQLRVLPNEELGKFIYRRNNNFEEELLRLYFVVETKGSVLSEDLREKEKKKIKSGTNSSMVYLFWQYPKEHDNNKKSNKLITTLNSIK